MATRKNPRKSRSAAAKKSSRLEQLKNKWLGDAPASSQNRRVETPSSPRIAARQLDVPTAADSGGPAEERPGPLSWDQIEKIVKRDLPGHEAVPPQPPTSTDFVPRPESISVPLKTMKYKYWNESGSADSAAAGNPSDTQDAIVLVRRTSTLAADSPANKSRGPGLKVAVISGKEKKIIGKQG
jgi:hypothetical protein